MKPETRRLFFALWPGAELRRELAALARGLELPERARRVHPEDLHLTLQYLGPVPVDRMDAVRAAAGGVHAGPVTLDLARVGCWPRPQIAWCAPLDVPSALPDLVDRLGERLAAVGYPREDRPFRPHVTLARKVRRLDERPLPRAIPWESADFALVESLSVAEPPRYKVLGRWPLTEKLENKKRTN